MGVTADGVMTGWWFIYIKQDGFFFFFFSLQGPLKLKKVNVSFQLHSVVVFLVGDWYDSEGYLEHKTAATSHIAIQRIQYIYNDDLTSLIYKFSAVVW